MTLPGPEQLKITKSEGGYYLALKHTPSGRRTPVLVHKVAYDEFELKAMIKEVYG